MALHADGASFILISLNLSSDSDPDPGLVFVLGPPRDVHQALGLNNSPILCLGGQSHEAYSSSFQLANTMHIIWLFLSQETQTWTHSDH